MSKEENFEKGLMLSEFLKNNKPKGEFLIDGFPVVDWDSFVTSHCGVLESKGLFIKGYRTYKVWYMRAYNAKKHIENEQGITAEKQS